MVGRIGGSTTWNIYFNTRQRLPENRRSCFQVAFGLLAAVAFATGFSTGRRECYVEALQGFLQYGFVAAFALGGLPDNDGFVLAAECPQHFAEVGGYIGFGQFGVGALQIR